jgi:hypothetical protein
MDHFAGLDVSVKETSVCIVDDTGKIAREVKIASKLEALLAVLRPDVHRTVSRKIRTAFRVITKTCRSSAFAQYWRYRGHVTRDRFRIELAVTEI